MNPSTNGHTSLDAEVVVDAEFAALIDPPTAAERELLEQRLLKEGCLDDLKVWHRDGKNILLDGHTRLVLCRKHNIPYRLQAIELESRADAIRWIKDFQLGRRNLSPERMSYLRGKLYLEEKKNHGGDRRSERLSSGQNVHPNSTQNTSQKIAAETGVNEKTIRRDGKYAEALDEAEKAEPGTRKKILDGEVVVPKGEVVKAAREGGGAKVAEKAKEKKAPNRRGSVTRDGEINKKKTRWHFGHVVRDIDLMGGKQLLKEPLEKVNRFIEEWTQPGVTPGR